jgi:hypothetical protein
MVLSIYGKFSHNALRRRRRSEIILEVHEADKCTAVGSNFHGRIAYVLQRHGSLTFQKLG